MTVDTINGHHIDQMSKEEKLRSAIILYYYEVPVGRLQNWFMTEDKSLAESNLEFREVDLDDLYDASCVGMDVPWRNRIIKTEIGCVEWKKTIVKDAIGRDEVAEQFEYIW